MSNRLTLALAALLLAVSLPVAAVDRGDAQAGEKKAAACVSCHGEKGQSSNPQYPKLAGQYADYIVRSLMGYKSGARQNPVMKGMVGNLSEEDMWDLAAYFSSQSGKLTTMER